MIKKEPGIWPETLKANLKIRLIKNENNVLYHIFIISHLLLIIQYNY